MTAPYKVKIAARLRPRLPNELGDDSIKISRDFSSSSICIENPRDSSQVFKFPFTSCYDGASTQDDIFSNDVKPLIDVVYGGVTVTTFAYGVTSSGKTYTMQGTKSEPGVIPRTVQEIFAKKAQSQHAVSIAVSYMEIYKDEVYDLLVDRETALKLSVRENDAGKVFVSNLTSLRIESPEEFNNIYARATRQRSVGSTNLNNSSSRSHAVLTIEVRSSDESQGRELNGKFNLVDLAGSENNKLTGNDPSRMAESSAINKSLSVLGQVVHALNQGASRIPYRNSKLTRILQDALGGQSIGLLICNLAPGIKFRQDTLNTLNFAVRTKNIENRPVIDERKTQNHIKPRFAALQPPAFKPAPAVLQSIATISNQTRTIADRHSIASSTHSAFRSEIPQSSTFRGRPSGIPPIVETGLNTHDENPSDLMAGLDKDIESKIARLVEAEVAKHMEQERERAREEKSRCVEEVKQVSSLRKTPSPDSEQQTLPSGVLTPLLKRHQDLDDELKSRLRELERKFERGSKEMRLVDVLSPLSRKKTGRAYVALARAHSEKGDLQVALDLYRRAETYVPDNIKLKERIIEIEWAVKNDTTFVPSPKRLKSRGKRAKGEKASDTGKNTRLNAVEEDVDMDPSHPHSAKVKRKKDDEECFETPSKKQRRGKAKPKLEDVDNDRRIPSALPRDSKRIP